MALAAAGHDPFQGMWGSARRNWLRSQIWERDRGTRPTALARWQDRLTPLQVWFAGGCHPNRDTQAAIADAGFAIGPLEVFEPTPNSPITRPFIQGAAARPPGGRTR
jgi:hypothetical protein